MHSNQGVYYRRRAEFHLARSTTAKMGVACIHRQFARLYFEQAMTADRADRSRAQAPRLVPDLAAAGH